MVTGDGTLRLWDVSSPGGGGEIGCTSVGRGVELLSCTWNKYNEVRGKGGGEGEGGVRGKGREGERGEGGERTTLLADVV